MNRQDYQFRPLTTDGFTLLEVITVTVIVGVLAAIAVPNWLSFTNTQRLREATNQTYQAISDAQRRATREKTTFQASFRDCPVSSSRYKGVVWLLHQAPSNPDINNIPVDPCDSSSTAWNSLDSRVQIDGAKTTVPSNTNNIYRIQFDYRGNPRTIIPGKITLKSSLTSQKRGCVVVATLLGSLQKKSDQDCN
jgi:prepilin-type N-terminal cleavage/methylation domain-containing protein